jgi:hypothetical protein
MRIIPPGGFRFLFASAAALTFLLAPWAVRADEPSLVVHLLGGSDHSYPVTQIKRVVFENTTLVIVKILGSDSYEVSTIRKLDFNWVPSDVTDPGQAAAMINAMHLFQNKPNPFTTQTRIGFKLPAQGRVELQILGADGRLIRTLLNDVQAAGAHEVLWDGLGNDGRKMPSGVYFYRLAGPGIQEGRQMIFLP